MTKPGFLFSLERHELVTYARSRREDHGIAQRANAILLIDAESRLKIVKFFYLDEDTILSWYKTCRVVGRYALSSDDWNVCSSRMAWLQKAEFCIQFGNA